MFTYYKEPLYKNIKKMRIYPAYTHDSARSVLLMILLLPILDCISFAGLFFTRFYLHIRLSFLPHAVGRVYLCCEDDDDVIYLLVFDPLVAV